MMVEQTVNDSGREDLGSCLSSAKVGSSSSLLLPTLSSAVKLDSQKARLTTALVLRLNRFPFELAFAVRKTTQTVSKNCFILKINSPCIVHRVNDNIFRVLFNLFRQLILETICYVSACVLLISLMACLYINPH